MKKNVKYYQDLLVKAFEKNKKLDAEILHLKKELHLVRQDKNYFKCEFEKLNSIEK